jgi:hypothetical protein
VALKVITVGSNQVRTVYPNFKVDVDLSGSWYGGKKKGQLRARCNPGILSTLEPSRLYGVSGQFKGNSSGQLLLMKVAGTPIGVEPLPKGMVGQNYMKVEGVGTIT